MYVNLHTLPADQAMFTVYVTLDPEGTHRSEITAEEVDIVYKRNATWGEIASYGTDDMGDRIVDAYGPDARIVGIVNQSEGYVLFDAFGADGYERPELGPDA